MVLIIICRKYGHKIRNVATRTLSASSGLRVQSRINPPRLSSINPSETWFPHEGVKGVHLFQKKLVVRLSKCCRVWRPPRSFSPRILWQPVFVFQHINRRRKGTEKQNHSHFSSKAENPVRTKRDRSRADSESDRKVQTERWTSLIQPQFQHPFVVGQ